MNRCYLDHLSTHPDLMTPNVLDVLGSFPRWQRWPS